MRATIECNAKSFLVIFVQCNILPLMRAVERARSRQVNPKCSPNGGTERDETMIKNIEDVQKMSKDNMDATMKSFGVFSKTSQAIAAEVVDYSKKSFEDGSKVMEKLLGVKSLEKAIEIQTDYAKSAYEGFVAQATKMGELYADLAKETYKPFEAFAVKAAPAK
jgi:hypothetical protein